MGLNQLINNFCMKKASSPGLLVGALMAVTSSALENVNHQLSANFAQSQLKHETTIIEGVLTPCLDPLTSELLICPDGQFVWRTTDPANAENDCTCRYELRHCDNEYEEFNVLTGECVCVERGCHDNHFWSFNNCACECVTTFDCPSPDEAGNTIIWDQDRCECICEPQTSEDPSYTWNIADCAFECLIHDCPENQVWDIDSCGCICEPQACPRGYEWFGEPDCSCFCVHQDCPRGFYFDSDTCNCLCEPYECPTSHYFDTRVCGCVCQEPDAPNNCPTDFFWNTQTCRCECSYPDKPCDPGFYLDTDVCECKCQPTECGEDEIFNETICECVCCPMQCPDNFYWDTVNCECACAPVDCAAGFYWNQDHCHCDCLVETCENVADQNNNYYFDVEECACKCTSPVTPCGELESYDTEKCQCVCVPQTCDPGFHWSIEHCQCVCNPKVCPYSQYWRTDLESPEKCGCFCHPQACQAEYHWDEEICHCVCSPQECGAEFFWDSEQCRCRCLPQDCSSETIFSVWDNAECKCKCAENPQSPCPADTQYFDHITCQCLCAPNQECSEGFYWDTRTCGCLPEHCECAVGYYFNHETLECECLPQACAAGYEWSSLKCACQVENIVCPEGQFWDPDTATCRCFYTIPAVGFYWDMDSCSELPINECPEGHYWSDLTNQCECAFQPPYTGSDGIVYTWNTLTCAYMCAPMTCLDDTYYWDADQCKCACHLQECDPNHNWDPNMCMCVCSGMPWQIVENPDGSFSDVQECPCGTVWDEGCCECKTCVDQGQCGDGEFFNPATCSCACLPECCDEPLIWSLEICECVDASTVIEPTPPPEGCLETTAVCNFMLANGYPLELCAADQEIGVYQTCAEVEQEFDPVACACVAPGSGGGGGEGCLETTAVCNFMPTTGYPLELCAADQEAGVYQTCAEDGQEFDPVACACVAPGSGGGGGDTGCSGSESDAAAVICSDFNMANDCTLLGITTCDGAGNFTGLGPMIFDAQICECVFG